jgi:GNAT superfamily N-acetyltransferase
VEYLSDEPAGIVFRQATIGDIPAMFDVRTSVVENAMTWEQLADAGITPASVAASLMAHRRAWVAERGEWIVGFSMADDTDGSIFALFVRPSDEGRGVGTRLLDLAVQWLSTRGRRVITLTTAPGTRASAFYARRGWIDVGTQPNGEVRFELRPRS